MPDWKRIIRERLAAQRLPRDREYEIVEELAQHAEDQYRELQSRGTSETEAYSLVLAEFPAGRKRGYFLDGMRQDVGFGLRTLFKNSGVTSIAVLALALGIGANTAIFSVVNGVLLRPLPYPDYGRLVRIAESTKEYEQSSVAYPNYLDWRRDNRSFTGMAIYRSDDLNFTGIGEPERLVGKYVSPEFFNVLGVKPVLGRGFLPDEGRRGTPCPVVLSHAFWRGRFGADPNILGRTLTLNAVNCTVIGVLDSHFRFRGDAKVYVPIEQWNSVELYSRESHPGSRVIARLKPGVTLTAARDDMTSIANNLASMYPASNAGHGAALAGFKDDMVGYIRPTLGLLAGAVGFVLIIACANVANLLLVRATERRREFAVRFAMGAERGRVIRQLLTESVLLSLGAAAVGLLVARWGTSLVLAAVPDSLPRAEEIGIDPSVLLFTVVVSVLTGILFGLAPAFHGTNANPQESLKEGTRGSGGGRHRAEGVFVAIQTGLAVILLTGAGLMIQSIWRLWQVDPGFNTGSLLTTQVALSPKVMKEPPAIRLSYQQMIDRVTAIPGVQSAALTASLPLSERDSEIPFWPGTGPQPPQDKTSSAMFYIVTPDYPKAMQIPLKRGRFLNARDTTSSPPVVVIDDVLAQHLFPGQDPVGRQMSLMVVGPVQIVGVVGHVKHWGLDADDTNKIRDQIYFPFSQVPDKFMTEAVAGLTLVLRTTPDPLSLVSALRSQVAGPTQDQPIYDVRTMEQVISDSLAERRFAMLMLIIFAATALMLAAVGIYGVMSYAVTRRTHELGIRFTMGASKGQIVGLVVRQGMVLAAAGMAVGLAAALALTRLMSGLLYGVEPADPATLAAVLLLLGGIALFACYLPARRAAGIDPAVALRSE